MSTPGPWKVDTWRYPARESGRKEEIVVVSETLRIAVLDHGDKDWETCPFAVSYKEAEENAKLIASAPALAERVRILREALGEVRRMVSVKGRWLDDTGCAVESEENDGTDPDVRPDVEGCLTWEEYTLADQNAALEAIEERALAALEATREA